MLLYSEYMWAIHFLSWTTTELVLIWLKSPRTVEMVSYLLSLHYDIQCFQPAVGYLLSSSEIPTLYFFLNSDKWSSHLESYIVSALMLVSEEPVLQYWIWNCVFTPRPIKPWRNWISKPTIAVVLPRCPPMPYPKQKLHISWNE